MVESLAGILFLLRHSDFAADRHRRRSASTSRHHPSSSTSGHGARVGRLRIAISSARTVDRGIISPAC
jgi:hypothetical protein